MNMTSEFVHELWGYQSEDVPFFLENRRSLILYEPRLGKTVVTCKVLTEDESCKTGLVVCSKNAMFTWRDHLKAWYAHRHPDKTVDIRLVRGKGSKAAAERKQLWLKERTADFTLYIVTFGSLGKDFSKVLTLGVQKGQIRFDAVIGDEVHLRCKNRKNKAVEHLGYLAHPSRCRRFHPLSGTMAGKHGPADFWALLNICDAKRFSSYWRFAYEHCEVFEGQWGKEILGPRNLDTWHKLLDQYSRRRFKKTCAPWIPQTVRSLKKVEPSIEQLNLVSQLEEDGVAWVNDSGLIVSSTSLEKVLRKRQIMTCPKMLHPKLGVGAALEDLIEQLTDPETTVTEDDKHIVVFTAFRQALDPFEKAFRDAGFQHVYQIYGGIEPEELEKTIHAFKQNKGIMLCSIKYAQAFSLASSKQCYFIGYEWDPNDNKQAEERLVPSSGHDPINSYYYSIIGLDEGIARAVSSRNEQISLTIGSAQSLQKGRGH